MKKMTQNKDIRLSGTLADRWGNITKQIWLQNQYSFN